MFKVNVTGVAKPLVFEFALQQQDGLCGNPGTVSVAEIKSAVAEAKVGGEEKRRAYIFYGRRLFTHVSEYRVYTLLATPWYSPTQSVRVESWLLILHLRITPHFNNIFTLPLSCAIFPASTPSSSFLPSVLMSFCVYQVVCASTGALGVQTFNMCWWSLLQNGFHVTYWRRPSASSLWILSLLKNKRESHMSSNGCSRTGETCEIRSFRLQALHLATRITVPNHWRCCWGCAEGRAVLGQCWEPWDLRNLGKILRHVAVQPTFNIGSPSSCVSAWRKYVDARSRTAGVLDVPLRPFVYIYVKKKCFLFSLSFLRCTALISILMTSLHHMHATESGTRNLEYS